VIAVSGFKSVKGQADLEKRLLALMKGYYPNVKKRLLKMLVSFLLVFWFMSNGGGLCRGYFSFKEWRA